MKKTLNVNLNGRVFTIDEDAYHLLDNYLTSLRDFFRKEEGSAEIIMDFEARIEELFSEKTRLGHQVISLEHVEEVIARVGKPTDFEGHVEDEKKRVETVEPEKSKKRLYRNMDDKLIGGVCSGLAAYFGWSVVAIRIILIIAPFVVTPFAGITHFDSHFNFVFPGPGNFPALLMLAYLIMWLVVPAASTIEQKLQMHGKPITVENIGKKVAAESVPVAQRERKGCLAGFVNLVAAFIKVFFAGLGCLIGLPLLLAFIVIIIALIAVMLGVGGGMVGMLGFSPFLDIDHPVLAMITGFLILGIPVAAIIYAIVSHFAKLKPLHQSVKWLSLLIWIVAFVLFFFSGFWLNGSKLMQSNAKIWGQSNAIVGNNIPSQKTVDFDEYFSQIEIGEYLISNIYIEQIQDNALPSIEIKGDENLVELVRYELYDGKLRLSSSNRMRGKKSVLTIHIQTGDLKSIHAGFVGDIRMERAFAGDAIEIVLEGIGNLRADSLYFNSLSVHTEGLGAVDISGKAYNTSLVTRGAGSIDASELLSDHVYAQVNGVGSIHCNPTESLEGHVDGIGSITYQEEPKNKNVSFSGIGKIKRR